MTTLLIAAMTFVGTHFLLSHPLRAPVVRMVGESAFLGVYSVVAIGTMTWMVIAYRSTPATDLLWPVGDVAWASATLLMLVACVLLVGSLSGNPAFPKAGAAVGAPAAARGVYAVTRHPMLWAFAIWGFCHILVFPIAKTFVIAGAIIVLSLVGAAFQDRKKERLEPTVWPAWERKTSYFPFAAIVAGRARPSGFGVAATLGGLAVWLTATWAHIPLGGWPAGVWRWL